MSLEWFEFHPKSFITDTMRLNTEAKGAYLLLILDYYEKEGPAPDDDDVLAAITGLSIETWRRHRRVIEPLFTIERGAWTHSTCESVIIGAKEKIAAAAAKAKAAAEARWNRRPRKDAPSNATSNAPGMLGASPENSSSIPQAEADFGPASQKPSSGHAPSNASSIPQASEMLQASSEQCLEHASSNAPAMHSNSNKEEREGANAPSSAGELSIGSLLPSYWTLTAEQVGTAKAEGIPLGLLAEWLDDWKYRCIDAGTRVDNWNAAWEREYHRRMLERAKAKPKPKVAVSKKSKLTSLPDGWKPSVGHQQIAIERKLNLDACVESFGDYIVNKHPDWRDADAAFRNWLKSPHRTEFLNGQATQRRAPAPGSNSIVDAFDRIDAALAARGGSVEEGQPHGQALVHRLPEE